MPIWPDDATDLWGLVRANMAALDRVHPGDDAAAAAPVVRTQPTRAAPAPPGPPRAASCASPPSPRPATLTAAPDREAGRDDDVVHTHVTGAPAGGRLPPLDLSGRGSPVPSPASLANRSPADPGLPAFLPPGDA